MGGERRSQSCWGLVWLPLLLMDQILSSAEQTSEPCAASRCGIITNISHPFRLRDDPPHCGDPELEIACENSVPLIHLYDDYYNGTYREVAGTYRVLGINYTDFTIRLVDAGIQDGNCSSFPRYSFPTYWDPYDYYSFDVNSNMFYLINTVGYLNCSDPVRGDAAYVDTAPCLNWEGGGHVYAVAGELPAERFQPQCRLMLLTPIDLDWKSLLPAGGIKSYADIHTLLSYGFELSWWNRACDLHCPDGTFCHFNPGQPLRCYSNRKSFSEWLHDQMEDFDYGIGDGLLKIVGKKKPGFVNGHFSRSNIARPLGAVIGRFVLPFITSRLLFGIIFLIVLLTYTCRKRHLSMYENIEDFIRLHNLLPIRYSYKNLKAITGGFKNKLGEGGFGTVYKGKLKSGIDVAVKILGNTKSNGQEFINEVATIGRIHHYNVVNLVGFSVEGTKRALVYEFMSNGSLDKYIFSKEGSVSLSYHRIYEISLGVAHGIAYLHHGCDIQILHFDIKPHNILLDDNFTPKISDFGLARLYSVDDSIVTLTAARGTIGYMAPELFYKNIGGVSYKADVYSFGMLLMEMASRRRNLNPHAEHSSQLYFPLWIYDQFDEEKDIELEDLTREEKNLARKMFIIALWCIQLKPADRPSMKKVIEMLEVDDIRSLEMPSKPSLYPNESVTVDEGSSSTQTIFATSSHSHNNSGEGTSNGK